MKVLARSIALLGLVVALLGTGASAAATRRSLRVARAATKKTEKKSIFGGLEAFAQHEASLVSGVDFGSGDPDEFSAAMTPPGAGTVTDAVDGSYKDEMLPNAPATPPRQELLRRGQEPPPAVNVGEYADVQSGLLAPTEAQLSPSTHQHRVVIPSPSNSGAKAEQLSLARLSARTDALLHIPAPTDASPESDATDSAQLSMAAPAEAGGLPESYNATKTTAEKKKRATLLAEKKVVAEYDLGVTKEAEAAEADEETQEEGAVMDGERLTKEDVRRLARKDGVTKLAAKKRATSKRLTRRRSSSHKVVKGRRAGKFQSAHRDAKPSHAQMSSKVKGKSAETAEAPGPEKMKGQCMSFGSYLKSQDIQGIELVRVWKSTCDPAVMDGTATPPYQLMCNSLGGAVEEFANQPNWDPGAVCDAVIRVFNEAGIGTLR